MRLPLLFAATLLSASALAAPPPDHYRARTAGDLARLCGTPASAPDAATAIAFCHGVLAGAYGYYVASTPPGARYICPPDPAPTRSKVADGFVAWMKGRPQLADESSIDALFRFAGETYPCKR